MEDGAFQKKERKQIVLGLIHVGLCINLTYQKK